MGDKQGLEAKLLIYRITIYTALVVVAAWICPAVVFAIQQGRFEILGSVWPVAPIYLPALILSLLGYKLIKTRRRSNGLVELAFKSYLVCLGLAIFSFLYALLGPKNDSGGAMFAGTIFFINVPLLFANHLLMLTGLILLFRTRTIPSTKGTR